MKSERHKKLHAVMNTISQDRTRSNFLKKYEQRALAYMVQFVPSQVSSDMLTVLGFVGSMVVLSGFVLATYINKYFLLMGIIGLYINWFGDSLDGRLAYYRHHPRKWYGFSLDITVDWLTTILIGCGYMIYTSGNWKILGFGFVVLYGWAMITTLVRYKVSGKYIIDSGALGPTEVRIIISTILILEVFVVGSILYSAIAACVILFVVNIIETMKLLRLADSLDKQEKEAKNASEQ
jgi:hypothetical protein